MTDFENDIDIDRVLNAAGARPQPSAELIEGVRAATQAEWRAVISSRVRRRRVVWAVAAALVLVILSTVATRVSLGPPGEEVSSGNRSLTLAYPNAVSVRLDRNTRIVRVGDEHITLRSGALYVDASHPGSHLQIQTPAGAVSHLGTQYEVRLLSTTTRIRVREGLVQFDGDKPSSLAAGDQLTISSDGTQTHGIIASDSKEWAWASNAAPPFPIEGHSLADFLTWAGRELGCEIVYSTPAVRATAERTVLNGSIAGLTPTEALASVLPTTGLHSSRRNGQIVIEQ